MNEHDDWLLFPQKEKFNLNLDIKIPESPKKKIGEEGYLPAPVDVLTDAGWKKMRTDGTIEDVDDYASASLNDPLWKEKGAMGLDAVEQRQLIQKVDKLPDVEPAGGTGNTGMYNRRGVIPPEDIHRTTKLNSSALSEAGSFQSKDNEDFWSSVESRYSNI